MFLRTFQKMDLGKLPMARGFSAKTLSRKSPLRNCVFNSQRLTDSDRVEIFKNVAYVVRTTANLGDMLANCHELRSVEKSAQEVVKAANEVLELIQLCQKCHTVVNELDDMAF